MIGRQKGNFDVLRQFLHLNETTLNRVKGLGMTEKGKKSEFLIVIGEKAETTHSLYIVPTPLEYWLLTTYPRERWYRQWWLAKNPHLSLVERYEELATKFPHGLSELPELPEERSGEVSRLGVVVPAGAGKRRPTPSESAIRNVTSELVVIEGATV
jgi:hypothetical protein